MENCVRAVGPNMKHAFIENWVDFNNIDRAAGFLAAPDAHEVEQGRDVFNTGETFSCPPHPMPPLWGAHALRRLHHRPLGSMKIGCPSGSACLFSFCRWRGSLGMT